MIGEPAAKRHGFLQLPPSSDGIFPDPITLDVNLHDAAGSVVTAFATVAFGINPSGLIVGQYQLVPGGPLHGFVAVPVN
jgi:hypothetical protein